MRAGGANYRDQVEQANSIILRMDTRGILTFVNEFAERFFLFTKEEMLGRSVVGTIVPDTDSAGRKLASMIEEIGQNPDLYVSNENENIRRTGERVWIAWTNRPIADKTGKTVEILCIGNDITEHKRMEEALRVARDELEVRVRERTADLARANEDLRLAAEKQHHTLEGVIRAVSLTLEIRDPYTAGHQRRVAQLASAMAREMGLPEERIEGLQLAASIHDIGKISVPAEILCKPGKISEAEFSLVKAHAAVGHDILEPIDFPWPIARIVRQHHEKMDGSGYPEGLSGSQILLEARILTIADVVEAMASHRPYRPALGIDVALEEIAGNSGRLYDTEAGSACLKLFRENGFAFQ